MTRRRTASIPLPTSPQRRFIPATARRQPTEASRAEPDRVGLPATEAADAGAAAVASADRHAAAIVSIGIARTTRAHAITGCAQVTLWAW